MGYTFTQYSYKTGVDVSVVQSTGTSTVDVMSQDATTRELNSVKRALNKSASALLELQNGVITPVGSFQTDSDTAYIKNVPENALPYAEVKKIGGRTVKTGGSNNLLPYPYSETTLTRDGISFFDNGDGSISIDGTAEDSVVFVLASGGMNFGSQDLSCKGTFAGANGYVISNPSSNVTFAYYAETGECLLTIAEGTTVIQETIYPMVNAGDSPLEWEPYSAGTLRSALVTEVESVGKNLFDSSKLLAAGWTVDENGVYSGYAGNLKDTFTQANPYMTFENVESLTLSFYGRFAEGQSPLGLYFMIKYDDGSGGNVAISNTTDTHYTFTTKAGARPVALYFYYGNASGTHYLRNIQIEEGTTATEYEPYVRNTLPIPTEVRGSENLLNIPQTFVKDSVYYGYDLFTGTVGSDTAVPQEKVETLPYLTAGEYYFSYNMDGGTTQDISVMQVNNDGSIGATYINNVGKFTVPHDTRITLKVYTNEVVTIKNIMLIKGTSPLPYEPYGITGIDGYGLGVSDTVYNYIDLEDKTFVKKCPMVDLGTLDFGIYSATDHIFFANITGKKPGPVNLLTGPYVTSVDTSQNGTVGGNYENSLIYIHDDNYTDAASFKAAMSGVMLVYELATPVVTDISDLISADNFIKVEGNGTLTFKNTYEYAVPSEVEYQVGV